MAKREPKLLRISAAAHELGLHPITVRRWIKAGRIQVVPPSWLLTLVDRVVKDPENHWARARCAGTLAQLSE